MNIEKPKWLVHYWILGFILAIIGLTFLRGILQVTIILIGAVIFLSDIKSFAKIEVPQPKIPEIKIKPGAELKKMFLPNEKMNKKNNPSTHKAMKGKKSKKIKRKK